MPDPMITRRELLAAGGLLPFSGSLARAQSAEALEPLNRFPRMVQERFVDLVRAAQRERLERFDAVRTREDAEAYVADVGRRIGASFGPFPEKTPLNARVTGGVERDAYTIENVVFESRPGFQVTANYYRPRRFTGKIPGVVGSCGHSTNGKAAETYQSFAQGLARQGYAVLLYDPISQGERLQYVDEDFESRLRPGVREHLYAGNQQFLVDEFIGSWRAWDGVRALDYLLSREEVDPDRVGVTGNSGGGTMTTWLCGLERRWTMAAPSCFVTTFRRNLENELPADTEQCPPRAIALGLDHEDFLIAMAPKPVIVLAKERDFFDVRGTEEAYWRLKRFWALLGAEEKVGLFIGPSYHGYSQENREAMYRWFNRFAEIDASGDEPELTMERDEDLWATPRGQVAAAGSRPIFSFTAEIARDEARGRAEIGEESLVRALQADLRLPERATPDARILRNLPDRGSPRASVVHYAVETEPDVFALVYRLDEERQLSRPFRTGSRAVLYVSHHSADAELRDEPLGRELLEAEPEAAFFAMDVRGIGESRPDTCGADSFLDPYGSDYFYAVHSLMLDRPYVGQKTHDVLAVLDWLRRYGHDDVHLAALGWGTFPATFAGVLGETVTQVTLKGSLTSYQELAEAEEYDWPLSCFVPGVVGKWDLPDCRRALERKRLRVKELRGPRA